MGVNVRRLQEVVDKGSELICRDDQVAYAITVGARGHTTRKVGEVTSRTKSWEISSFLHFVSYTFFKFSILICNDFYNQHRSSLM